MPPLTLPDASEAVTLQHTITPHDRISCSWSVSVASAFEALVGRLRRPPGRGACDLGREIQTATNTSINHIRGHVISLLLCGLRLHLSSIKLVTGNPLDLAEVTSVEYLEAFDVLEAPLNLMHLKLGCMVGSIRTPNS